MVIQPGHSIYWNNLSLGTHLVHCGWVLPVSPLGSCWACEQPVCKPDTCWPLGQNVLMNCGTEGNAPGCLCPSTTSFCRSSKIRLDHGISYFLPSCTSCTTVQTIHRGIKHSQICLFGRILYLLYTDGTECPLSSLGYLLAKPIFLLLSCNFLISVPAYLMCVYVLQAGTLIWSQTWHCLFLMVSQAATYPILSAELWPKSLLPFWLSAAFGCQNQRQPSSETRATAVNLKQIFFILNATAGQLNRKE